MLENSREGLLGNQHKISHHLIEVKSSKNKSKFDFNLKENCSKSSENEEKRAQKRLLKALLKDTAVHLERRDEKYEQKTGSSNTESLRCKCGRVRVAFNAEVIGYNDGSVGLTGVARCHSLSECPWCNQFENLKRAESVGLAISNYERSGGFVYFVTLTCRHGYGDDLKKLRKALTKSYTDLWDGRVAMLKKKSMGYEGNIRVIDVTHGKNGWHPHLHVLLFLSEKLSRTEERCLETWMFKRWSRYFVKYGLEEPTRDRAIVIERAYRKKDGHDASRVAKYVLKTSLGNEMNGIFNKQGRQGRRTPWQILADYREHGRETDAKLWREWCKAMRGAKWLSYSHGLLKSWAGKADVEKPDARILYCATGESWDGITRPEIAALLSDAEQYHRQTKEQWLIDENERKERLSDWVEKHKAAIIANEQLKIIDEKPHIEQLNLFVARGWNIEEPCFTHSQDSCG